MNAEENQVARQFKRGCLKHRMAKTAHDEAGRDLRSSPQHQRALTNFGIVLAHQGRYQESFDAFAAVVGLAAAHCNLGMLLARDGRTEDAKAAFNASLRIDPHLAQAQAAAKSLNH
jgi:Tfp pilus assembly protein PilF